MNVLWLIYAACILMQVHLFGECSISNDFRKIESNLYQSDSTDAEFEKAMRTASGQGDIEAGGDLSFHLALGLKVGQDIQAAIHYACSLSKVDSKRAYTTLAFLYNHNLLTENCSVESDDESLLQFYHLAALKDDPIAQIYMSKHYKNMNYCLASLIFARQAAEKAIESISDREVSNPDFVSYINKEDMPPNVKEMVKEDLLYFSEYMAWRGDVKSAAKAANILLEGSDLIEKNIPKAVEMLKIAIDGNNTESMINLSDLYLKGLVDMDEEDALRLAEKALEYGNDLAHSVIGRFYLKDRGKIKQDLNLAKSHFVKGVTAGCMDAYYQMGNLYDSIEYNNSNYAAAFWFSPAVYGHVHSAFRYAEFHYHDFIKTIPNGNVSHDIQLTDNEESVCSAILSFYERTALAGEWKGLFKDAYIDYLAGRKSSSLAKYLLLSDMGYKAAHINAARLIQEQDIYIYDTNSNSYHKEALKVWLRVVDSGIPVGYTQIGHLLISGKGDTNNVSSAIEAYKKAFMLGDAEGGFNYALAAEWGNGIPQNLTTAKFVFQKSLHLDDDSHVPVILALFRLQFIEFIHRTTGWNFHNYETYSKISLPDWDLLAIFVLSLLICLSLYQRQNL